MVTGYEEEERPQRPSQAGNTDVYDLQASTRELASSVRNLETVARNFGQFLRDMPLIRGIKRQIEEVYGAELDKWTPEQYKAKLVEECRKRGIRSMG